jgi:hypothetical protein
MQEMKMHAKWIGTLLVVIVTMSLASGSAMALGVTPGAFCAQGVPVGQRTDTGVDVTIANDTDKERIFSIKVEKMAAVQDPSLRGYATMPDLSWFALGKTELTAPAKGSVSSRIAVNIPDDERYYNQHWGVSCLIEYGGQKGLFQEAVRTVYMFETKSKADVKARPLGDLGVAPSIVSIDLADPAMATGSFKIYNNTAETRKYKLSAAVPSASGASLKLNPSPGFTWLPDAATVVLKMTSVSVKPGGTADVSLTQKVPASLLVDGCMLEAVVFIEPDKGQANFVRVHIEKTPAQPQAAGKDSVK